VTADRSDDAETCRWCAGSGFVSVALAYVPGPNPFAGEWETAFRPGTCKHCEGTGKYDSALDPTVDWMRDHPDG
jgi:DnaJ-class molecular chaperone